MNLNNKQNHLHDNDNDDDVDDEENEIWEYETNYIAPELTSGMKTNPSSSSSLPSTIFNHNSVSIIIIINIFINILSSSSSSSFAHYCVN